MKYKAVMYAEIILIASSAFGIGLALILNGFFTEFPANSAVGTTHFISVGLLFLVLIVEIVSAIKIDDSTFHTALLTAGLFLEYLFAPDTQIFLSAHGIVIPNLVFAIFGEVAFVFSAIVCIWYIMYLYGLTMSPKRILAMLLPVGALLVVCCVLMYFNYGYIMHFLIVALLALSCCTVLTRAERKSRIGITTYFSIALFAFATAAQNVNMLYYSGLTLEVPGLATAYTALSFSMYIPVYLLFSIHSDSAAVKSAEYQQRAEQFESTALMGQIKPHFIFNALEAVRTLYNRDMDAGDAAIDYLSNFLRGSVQAFDMQLIPFETEIDNVFNYTEFENLKREDKIEVIFNIDYTDFLVPPFSIQPFVENAIRYSGVEKIENGCIVISSRREGDLAIVEIADNGKGFDLSEVSVNSHGIKNACGRFTLTLGTVPEIKSVVGAGTRIKIVIDLTREGEIKP